MKLDRVYWQSVRGQLTLLGAVFAGALVLAVAALLARDVLFEPFVREKKVEPPAEVKEQIEKLARGEVESPTVRADEVESAYRIWLDNPAMDSANRVADWLVSVHGAVVVPRVRQTLIVGSASERERALTLLARCTDPAVRPLALEVAEQERERARRRRESRLIEVADGVIHQLQS